jgi:hypothetical protein
VKFLSIAFAVTVSLFFAAYAQQKSSTARKKVPLAGLSQAAKSQDRVLAAADSQSPRRLESLTWNSVNHTLLWDVSTGNTKTEDASAYRPVTTDHYKIDMDKATMTYNGESRRFSEDEAGNVRSLMDVISKYAVESTIWWEQGQGDPVDRTTTPAKPMQNMRRPGQGKLPSNQITSLENPYVRLEKELLRLSAASEAGNFLGK